MGWKCAPQVLGLVRGEPKAGQKHRASIKKIAMEAGEERASKSDTLDRSRSRMNKYSGYSRGAAYARALTAAADAYRVKVPGKTKAGEAVERERGLRKDAVIGWAVIYNPPAEICAGWSDEQYEKFYADSRAVMAEIHPVFCENNRKMSAEHFDEGIVPNENAPGLSRHIHDLGVAVSADGRYCGNEIDAKLMATINVEYPKRMRERGWTDIDDLDVTDWDKYKENADYREERKKKARNSGKSVNAHMHQKAVATVREAQEIMLKAVQTADDQYETAINQEITRREQDAREKQLEKIAQEQEAARLQIEATAREQAELQEQLNDRDIAQRKVIHFIRKLIAHLGGNNQNIRTYPELMAALISATDVFQAKAKSEAEKEASVNLVQRERQLSAEIEEVRELRKDYLEEMQSVAKDIKDRRQARVTDLENRFSDITSRSFFSSFEK